MWQACVHLALRQEGLITLDQAVSLGCSPAAVRRRVASGHLERVLPGVFRLAGSQRTPRQALQAGCLWGGEEAAASHGSAAALLKLKGFRHGDPHIISVRNPLRLPSWIQVHRVNAPVPGVRPVAGIPATPPWRTLLDLGCTSTLEQVEPALDDALFRGLASLPQLRWALQAPSSPKHAGSRMLRALVEERGGKYAPPESDLEAAFFRLIEGSDLPPGVRQFSVWDDRNKKWRRFDLAFPETLVAIELDGWETHGTRAAFQNDRARDRALQLLGWRILRYTWDDIMYRPDQVLAEIREATAQNAR